MVKSFDGKAAEREKKKYLSWPLSRVRFWNCYLIITGYLLISFFCWSLLNVRPHNNSFLFRPLNFALAIKLFGGYIICRCQVYSPSQKKIFFIYYDHGLKKSMDWNISCRSFIHLSRWQVFLKRYPTSGALLIRLAIIWGASKVLWQFLEDRGWGLTHIIFKCALVATLLGSYVSYVAFVGSYTDLFFFYFFFSTILAVAINK